MKWVQQYFFWAFLTVCAFIAVGWLLGQLGILKSYPVIPVLPFVPKTPPF